MQQSESEKELKAGAECRVVYTMRHRTFRCLSHSHLIMSHDVDAAADVRVCVSYPLLMTVMAGDLQSDEGSGGRR